MTLGQLDMLAFAHVNAAAGLAGWRLETATLLAKWLVYLVPLSLIALWLWGGGGARLAAIRSLACAAGALLINQAIGLGWDRPRPFVIGLGHAFLAHAPDASFPSDHVTVMTAAGFALWSSSQRAARYAGSGLAAAGLAAGWARVFLGIHYPGDVLGGFAVGAAAACMLRTTTIQSWCAWLTRHAERIYRRVLSRPIARGWIRA